MNFFKCYYSVLKKYFFALTIEYSKYINIRYIAVRMRKYYYIC